MRRLPHIWTPAHDRPRSSLDRVMGEAGATDGEIRAMAARAWAEKGIAVFLPGDLAAMPEMARRFIEGEARRVYGRREARS